MSRDWCFTFYPLIKHLASSQLFMQLIISVNLMFQYFRLKVADQHFNCSPLETRKNVLKSMF